MAIKKQKDSIDSAKITQPVFQPKPKACMGTMMRDMYMFTMLRTALHLNIGDYCYVHKYLSDQPARPFALGLLIAVRIMANGVKFMVDSDTDTWYPYCEKVNAKQARVIKKYKEIES